MDKREDREGFILSELMTLKNAIETEEDAFPIVIKCCGNEDSACVAAYEETTLPMDYVLMLEKRVVISYAHLRVMSLENERLATSDKGAEFTAEYNGFVGEDILIPTDYPLPVQIIHPPGASNRYADVSQVLEDLPRYINVNVDVRTTPPSGHTCLPLVKKGTTMEVTKVIIQNDSRYIQCTSDQNETFYFCENTLVNFSAVQDKKTYTLSDLMKSNMLLPKVIKFQTEPSIDDIISSSNTWINNTSVMTYGPMQLLKAVQKELVVSWSRDGPSQMFREDTGPHYHVILIPTARTSIENVKVYKFQTTDDKNNYLEKNFPLDANCEFIENKLYVIRKNNMDVTYVDSNIRIPEDNQQESSEKWEDWYATPGPPIPPRAPVQNIKYKHPVSGRTKKDKLRVDIVDKIKEKARLGFDNLHRELVGKCNRAKRKFEKKTAESKVETKMRTSGTLDQLERRCLPPVPTPPTTPTDDISDERHNYISKQTKSETRHEVSKSMRPISSCTTDDKSQYEELLVGKQAFSLGEDSTEDFSTFSVEQVANCFEQCALKDFGEMCKEQKIDGAFLTNLDLDCLKKEPFNLNKFKVIKVKKVINGWRPLYDSLMN